MICDLYVFFSILTLAIIQKLSYQEKVWFGLLFCMEIVTIFEESQGIFELMSFYPD